MNDALLGLLACPKDKSPLHRDGCRSLVCESHHSFPIVDGVPVFLLDDEKPTMPAVTASLMRSQGRASGDGRAPDLHLDSLGISESEKDELESLSRSGKSEIDPVVQFLVAATCGIAYRGVMGRLTDYPIPNIPLPDGAGQTLLDVGCNWGRWSIAAARKGYRVIGIDPQLGAVVAAKRVSEKLGHQISYLCGDARFLPLRSNQLDAAFSYSVLQHFSPEDCERALKELERVLVPGGGALVQLANILGVRNLYQMMRRGFRRGSGFEVRYYLPSELKRLFEATIGDASLSVDCFFGLGLQESDIPLMTGLGKAAAISSARLRNASQIISGLTWLADSLYVRAIKPSA